MPPDTSSAGPELTLRGRRRRTTILVIAVVGVCVGLGTIVVRASFKRIADMTEIRKVFDGFVQSVRANDVEGLQSLAGPGTWAWAESILDAARHADAVRFAALGFYDQTTLLDLRIKHTSAELAEMKPADILGVVLEGSNQQALRLSQISISGDSASATISMILPSSGKAPIASGPLFTRQEGHWRMEWHLIPIQIMDRAGAKPANPRAFFRAGVSGALGRPAPRWPAVGGWPG